MKALVYNLNIPRYLAASALGRIFPRRYFAGMGCLSLKDVDIPGLPSEDWVIIKTEACGICGSDLNLLMGRDSFSMEPYSSFPAVLGHEAIGRICSVGGNVMRFKEGDRVAVDSVLPCVTRGIERPCRFCEEGDYALCENFTEGNIRPGPVNGYNASVGGGFGEYFVAHKSQLFPLPGDMSAGTAVFADPLASALQAASTHLPKDGETVMVYGGGIIGILLASALRALGCGAEIIGVARYDFQAGRMKEAGADKIIIDNIFDNFARVTGAKKMRPSIGKPVFEGGVDTVFDCVGTGDTIDNSLRFLRGRGRLVIVGAAGVLKGVDASPVWFKELKITGSSMYSHVNINGKRVRTYQAAVDMLADGKIKTHGLLTHTFGISEFASAINTALNKEKNKSIKVVFRYY